MPWMKLPRLDFVEVAGQGEERDGKLAPAMEDEAMAMVRLEKLADAVRVELEAGNIEGARALKDRLEMLMEEYGMEYEEGFQ